MRPTFALLPFLLAGAINALGSVDQGLLALVPADTQMVASIDVASAGSSEFGQHMLKHMNSNDKGMQDFIQQTGFDPRRDLQTVVFASSNPNGPNKPPKTVVLARGTFDLSRITASLRTMGARVDQFQGADIFIMKQDRHAIAFPETGVAVFGEDEDSVRGVIDRLSNPSALDPKLVQRIQTVGSANDIWFASPSAPRLLTGAGGPQFQGSEALKSILEASGGIQFGSLVKISADAVTRSPQDADSLASVVRFGVNMLQSQGQNDPHAAALASSLSGMDIQVNGSNVHVSLSVTEDSLEQLAQTAPAHAAR
jgi:hypothetical protein